MYSKIGFEMSFIVVEAIRGRCASFMVLTAMVSEIFHAQTNSPILVVVRLFFLWFPLCRGEAGLFVTPMYGYSCNSFPLVPVPFLSTFLPPLPFSGLSSHNPPILAVVFLVFCNHRASLSRIFSVISHLSF